MNLRARLRRTGIAFAVAGLFLSTVDVNPAGEIPRALADSSLPAAAAAAPAAGAPEAVGMSGAAPQKAPEGGDLTHLFFTATGALSAALTAPADGVASSTSATLEVETVKGGGVEVKVHDELVPFSRIGKRTIDDKTGETRYTYYGVPLAPGPNVVTLTPLGAEGARGEPVQKTIYAPGKPATIKVVVAGGPFRADGTTPDTLRVEATDAWGHRAAAGETVELVLVKGDARLERLSAAVAAASTTPMPIPTSSPGIVSASVTHQTLDLPLDANGTATVRVLPGLTPGELLLRVDCGQIARDASFYLAPNLRKPFVNGLITAGAGAVPGIPDEADTDADSTNSRRGRIAVFGTGAIGNALATFAYDTANVLQRTPEYGSSYAADPLDRPYQTTGDASVQRDDALSRDHLFARVDTANATAEWGEFRARTGTDSSALGAFDQLVDGAKLDVAAGATKLSGFAAQNDVGYDRRVLAPTGLANGILLRPNVVVGSDIVTLATLDRRTGAVLAQAPMQRGVDYTIEYATGQLHFMTIPLPYDDAFNPNELVVTYEFDEPAGSAKTVGGRVQTSFGPNRAITLGVGYVNDTSGAGNVTLASQDLGGSFNGGAWSIVHATSEGALLSTTTDGPYAGNGGSALHAQLARALGLDTFSFLYDRTSAGYDDPFGGLSTPGLLNEHLLYARKSANGLGELDLDLEHQANFAPGIAGTTQSSATLRARRQISKRLTVNASLERRVATNAANATPAPVIAIPGASPLPFSDYEATPAEASTQVTAGVDWRATTKVDVSVDRTQTLAGTNEVQPTQTDAQLTYDLGKGGRAYVRERWSASPVESFAASTQALTATTGGERATEFGFSKSLGPATSVDTSYVLDHTANGSDVYAATGVRQRFSLGALRGDAFVQHGTSVGSSSPGGFDLYGTTLSYADPSNRFRVSESTQLRTGAGGGSSITLGAAGALTADTSLFASVNDARAAGDSQDDERIGFAWRPSHSDAGVTLLQYEKLTGEGDALDGDTQSGVLSLEQVVRVRERTELVARYAYKVDGDAQYEAHSSLFGLRLDQRVGPRFDLGAEVRRENVLGIDGAVGTSFAAEAGLRLGDRTRLALGYNFSATADPALMNTPTHRGVYTTMTTVVDRIFGWGRP
ncbi:MAG TPA: hypothetical protein VFB22_14900 [Candidatus Baltobacteraceae bacterium]|nr:hypothetical protein [Candidatus Baltobacteraceae bacterium]